MRLPIRIQRRRARGWKMPAHTKYVGRGSLYGNPFRVARSARELERAGSLLSRLRRRLSCVIASGSNGRERAGS